MQDFISNGNGDSRYLKSVSDFLTRYPTYEDMAAALVAGTLPVDFNGINSSGVQQRGTPYNKASVLSDATAALLGLTSSATPNDAFAALSSGGGGGYYATCDTAEDVEEKVITVDGLTSLKLGTRLVVSFRYGNTVKNPKLNVNNFGALNIGLGDTTMLGGRAASWSMYDVVEFVLAKSAENYTDYKWHRISPCTHAATIIYDYYNGTGEYGSESLISIDTPGIVKSGLIYRSTNTSGALDFGIIGNNTIITCIDGVFSRMSSVGSDGGQGSYTFHYYSNSSAREQLNVSGSSYTYSFVCHAR